MRAELMHLLVLLIRIAVVLVAFAVGLDVAAADATWLLRRPARLLRSLLVVLVGVPLVALALVRLTPQTPAVTAGLLMVAISVGPVVALKRTRADGDDRSYALGLDLSLLIISIPFVPLAFTALGAVFGRRVGIAPGAVARVVLLLQLLPMAAGLIVARSWPRLTARLTGPVTAIGNGLLAVVALILLVLMARPMLAIGGRGLLAATTLAVAATALGHLFGGPERHARLALAAFSALRFPALALLLATKVQLGSAVILPVVLAYLLISLAVIAIYRVLLRAGGARPAATPLAPAVPA